MTTPSLPEAAKLALAVRDILGCPFEINAATVPSTGLDTPGLNLFQVVGTMHVALPRYRALKAALAALDAALSASAEPMELDDEATMVDLWAEIHRLRAAVKGPDGYASWQDAAVDERIRRVRAEKALTTPPAQAEPSAQEPAGEVLVPRLDSYSGGASTEGLFGRVRIRLPGEKMSVEYAPVKLVTKAASDIFAERQRQISKEGWTFGHDDSHGDGSMAQAAAAYALNASTWTQHGKFIPDYDYERLSPGARWPWPRKWWKPKSIRQDLIRAGALILAEIERLDRRADRDER